MLLWVLCAVLTAAVLYVVTRPLSAPVVATSVGDDDAASDLAVYRDQLKELEADRARGLMSDAEAEAARVEISRRLLARAEAGEATLGGVSKARSSRFAGIAFVAAAIMVPGLTLALYLTYGSPGLPDQPYAARRATPVDGTTIEALVAQVEARLQAHPEDGQGWDVIAPVYLRQGRFTEAAQAYRHAIRLLGETPRRLAGFGEATVFAANGVVSEEAKRAFEKLSELEPGRPEPRIWIALAREQDGDLSGALDDYRALIGSAPADAGWRSAVEERISILTQRIDGGAKPSTPGPSADDIAAAEKLAPAERTAMIERMVEGLAQRLGTDSQDLAGWQRLMRAYAVLGQNEKAADALEKARMVFAGDSASLATLDELARSLGLGS